MKLLIPMMVRLKPTHSALLRRLAKSQGHGNKTLALRLLLDREIASERSARNGNGKRSS